MANSWYSGFYHCAGFTRENFWKEFLERNIGINDNALLAIVIIFVCSIIAIDCLILRPKWGRIVGIIVCCTASVDMPVSLVLTLPGLFVFGKARALFGSNRLKHGELAKELRRRRQVATQSRPASAVKEQATTQKPADRKGLIIVGLAIVIVGAVIFFGRIPITQQIFGVLFYGDIPYFGADMWKFQTVIYSGVILLLVGLATLLVSAFKKG